MEVLLILEKNKLLNQIEQRKKLLDITNIFFYYLKIAKIEQIKTYLIIYNHLVKKVYYLVQIS